MAASGGEVADDPILGAVVAVAASAKVTVSRAGPVQLVVEVGREDYVALVEAARAGGFETFIDLCGVDHVAREPRFDVVVNLLSTQHIRRLLIKVGVPNEDPSLPSISMVYPGANFYERETWDMFGIVFDGHPDLTRLLMPDEWDGHPLRKDYRIGSVPVEFKATR
ncbi:MAG: NADH-quinone oxidoreductase subunit C [Actinobacteria bacterium]|nr:NADH-quinone oxidoreductase subunit C [Actinomycetota bacterium]MCZ6519795.1 NADH-quinone oxidoreductase subunit C [Actinomycetota bacterium]